MYVVAQKSYSLSGNGLVQLWKCEFFKRFVEKCSTPIFDWLLLFVRREAMEEIGHLESEVCGQN